MEWPKSSTVHLVRLRMCLLGVPGPELDPRTQGDGRIWGNAHRKREHRMSISLYRDEYGVLLLRSTTTLTASTCYDTTKYHPHSYLKNRIPGESEKRQGSCFILIARTREGLFVSLAYCTAQSFRVRVRVCVVLRCPLCLPPCFPKSMVSVEGLIPGRAPLRTGIPLHPPVSGLIPPTARRHSKEATSQTVRYVLHITNKTKYRTNSSIRD